MKEQPIEQFKPAEKLELRDFDKESSKTYKKICCPSCHEVIPADNLNLQYNVAKCGSCHVVFSIAEDVASVKTKKEMKQEVIRPEGIDLFYYKDELDITIQQHIQGLDAFGIAIFPAVAFFSIIIYFTKGIPIFYPAIFTAAALYFIYKVLNYSKNRAYIDINDKYLTIRNRPKNLKKDKTFAAADIDQLYLRNDGTGYIAIYMIINSLDGQKHQKLLNVNTLSKAKFLEQEIERYLKIDDRKVPEGNVT